MEDPLIAVAFSFKWYLRHCLLYLMWVRSTTAVVSYPLFLWLNRMSTCSSVVEPSLKDPLWCFFFFLLTKADSHTLSLACLRLHDWKELVHGQHHYIRLSSVHLRLHHSESFPLTWRGRLPFKETIHGFEGTSFLNQDLFVTCTVVTASDVIRLIVIIRNRCQNPCSSLLTQP